MKTSPWFVLLVITASFLPFLHHAAADEFPEIRRHAALRLLELDQRVFSEQYHHLRMEAFKARLEMQMTRIKLRHAPENEGAGASAEKLMAMHAERLELFERLIDETRERIMHLHLEAAELERAAAREPEMEGEHREWDGAWVGRDQGSEAAVHLRIEGEHVRMECPKEDSWYEGKFIVEREGDEFLEVAFQVEQCAQPEYQGKTSRGLARIQHGELIIAANEPGNPVRPSNLEPAEGTKIFVFERERERERGRRPR